MAGSKSSTGITLIQLLVTLAIISVLSSYSSSAFTNLIERERALRAMATFKSLLQYARSSAVYQHTPITVCAIDNSMKCSKDWGQRNTIVVFSDDNKNRALDLEEQSLRSLTWPAYNGFLRWRASLGRSYISFMATGNTWQNGSLYYCPADRNPQHAAVLIVAQSGRSYLSYDSNLDGIDEDRHGKNLTCEW